MIVLVQRVGLLGLCTRHLFRGGVAHLGRRREEDEEGGTSCGRRGREGAAGERRGGVGGWLGKVGEKRVGSVWEEDGREKEDVGVGRRRTSLSFDLSAEILASADPFGARYIYLGFWD